VDGPQSFFRTKPDRFVAEIQSDDPAIPEFRQHAQIGAGAGADIEGSSIFRKVEAGNLAAKQAAPAGEPPMGCFDFCFNGVRS